MSHFALKTLLTDRGKLLTALSGVVFSLVLVCVQGGLYEGLMQKASVLVDNSQADIWIGHRLVENVDLPHLIPEVWLNRVRGIPGVRDAEPYIVGRGIATLGNGGYEDVWVIGSELKSTIAGSWNFVSGNASALAIPGGVSVDRLEARKLGSPEIGDVLEINGYRARVVAQTEGHLNFITTPYLFANLETARRLSSTPDGECSYILVQLERGSDVSAVCDEVRRLLPHVDVYSKQEFAQLSKAYWIKRTGIGVSFSAATLLGIFVGMLMVAQSLYALALDHVMEYATLKAIGADDGQVLRVVILQAFAIGIFGSLFGIGLAVAIQQFGSTPLAPIEIPLLLLCGAVVLVFSICLISVILPWLRIRRVDPAMVLQG